MNIAHKRSFYFVIILTSLLTVLQVPSPGPGECGDVVDEESTRLDHGQASNITAHTVCHSVSNLSLTKDYFIPLKTAAEWQAFVDASATNSDMSFSACP